MKAPLHSITTFNITTLSIMTLSITTIKMRHSSLMTVSLNNNQHDSIERRYAKCRYAECRYAECRCAVLIDKVSKCQTIMENFKRPARSKHSSLLASLKKKNNVMTLTPRAYTLKLFYSCNEFINTMS
jgi:hypothetical protein